MRRIGKKQKEKLDWTIKYIKKEHKTGRHICACLGSAGFTFLDDVEFLAEYAESKGEIKFAKLIRE